MWYLILVLLYPNAVTVDHIEFNNKSACEDAVIAIRDKVKSAHYAVCVRKGL